MLLIARHCQLFVLGVSKVPEKKLVDLLKVLQCIVGRSCQRLSHVDLVRNIKFVDRLAEVFLHYYYYHGCTAVQAVVMVTKV